MLTIIQIIAILQGIFLAVALVNRREKYKSPIFGLFIGCIVSVVLFSLGDDDYNLVVSEARWFVFHEPLMITFFFLFIRYSNTEKQAFNKYDILFFLPYLIYITFETLSTPPYFEGSDTLESIAEFIELSFLGMLMYSIYEIITYHKNKWLLAFIVPLTLFYAIDIVSSFFLNSDTSIFSLDSYGIFLIAVFLFYFFTYQLIIAPNEILPTVDHKYKSSKLSQAKVDSIKRALTLLMTEEKLFTNQNLNVNEVAEELGISRQKLSEVLNIHMGLRFQDLLNQYRTEEFIKYLQQESYANYTMFGIAMEAGFSSKSSFNATFKKVTGLTPSQYKKQHLG